jgi:hypothetical protein
MKEVVPSQIESLVLQWFVGEEKDMASLRKEEWK